MSNQKPTSVNNNGAPNNNDNDNDMNKDMETTDSYIDKLMEEGTEMTNEQLLEQVTQFQDDEDAKQGFAHQALETAKQIPQKGKPSHANPPSSNRMTAT